MNFSTRSSLITHSAPARSRVHPERPHPWDFSHGSATELLSAKRKLWRSIVLFNLSSCLVFCGINAYMNLVTSLVTEENIGIISLAVYGLLQLITCFFTTHWTRRWGSRAIQCISLIISSLYILANVYPTWVTMCIGAAFLGVGISLQWTTSNIFLEEIGLVFSDVNQVSLEMTLVMLYSLNHMAFQSGFLIGNTIAYFVLEEDNSSNPVKEEDLADVSNVCGAKYCNEDLGNLTQTKQPEQWRQIALCIVYICFSIIGICLMAGVGDYSEYRNTTTWRVSATSKDQWRRYDLMHDFMETLKMLIRSKQLLLVPITVYIGMEEALILADFTKAFIACSQGIAKIGLVMTAFGASQLVIGVLEAWLIETYGRVFNVLLSGCIQALLVIVLMTWQPSSNIGIINAIIVCLWGVVDATMLAQIFPMYSLIYEDNSDIANSVSVLWASFGHLFLFVLSPYTCMPFKMYLLLGVLFFGTAFYLILEAKMAYEQEVVIPKPTPPQTRPHSFLLTSNSFHQWQPTLRDTEMNDDEPHTKDTDLEEGELVTKDQEEPTRKYTDLKQNEPMKMDTDVKEENKDDTEQQSTTVNQKAKGLPFNEEADKFPDEDAPEDVPVKEAIAEQETPQPESNPEIK